MTKATIIAVAFCWLLPTTGFANPDQAFIPAVVSLSAALQVGNPPRGLCCHAQTFTAGRTGRLTDVQLHLNGQGPLQVSIYRTTAGVPTSLLQALPYRQVSSFGRGLVTFDGFDVPVTADQEYAIVVAWQTGSTLLWSGDRRLQSSVSPYPGGRAYDASSASGPWTEAVGIDYGFITFVDSGPDATHLPNSPSDVRAVVSGSSLLLNWNPPVGGAIPTGYRLEFYESSAGFVLSVVQDATPSAVLSIPPGINGLFRVVVGALVGGTISTRSEWAEFSIGSGGGCPPVGRPVVRGGVSGGVAQVEWIPVPNAVRYFVVVRTPQSGIVFAGNVGAVTSLSASDVPAGFQAYVEVFAVNRCGQDGGADAFLVR